ncbi:transcriptional activator of glycolytic enzymes-domain-containing protein [Lipomyces chichibuensis]|uniref:transcriptional activator of glycolytic enzymes-domain-containing protein n=1 Tax=Lipomyces chichibuensis TaxID=1546026 RepID=UPI003342F0FC
MIREMAATISTSRNGNGDDTGGKAAHESSASSQIVKLNEWNTWCKEIRKFTDGTTVTEDKICLFLPECIIPRFQSSQSGQLQPQLSQAQQHSGQQQNLNGSNGSSSSSNSEDSSQISESASPIEIYATLKSYVAVLVSQYLHQRRSGMNSHPHPHGVLLKAYLQKFRNAASACRNMAPGHSSRNGSSSSNSSGAPRRGSHHHHGSSRSHSHHNTQQRLVDSEYSERHSVPGLSPDVSDSEFDSFSDDGLAQSPDLVSGAVSGTGAGNGLGGPLSHNSRSLSSGSSGGSSGGSSARIAALIQSNVQLLRDSLQYVISMQTDKLSQQLTRENNELRLALDKQARNVTALSAMVDKIASWASTQAPDLAAEIAPSYRSIVSLNGSQPGSGTPGPTQAVSSVQLPTSQPQQPLRRDTNPGTYMTTSGFGTTNNVNDTMFGGNAMTSTASPDDSNNINIFKMAAATAAAARRHQIDQHPISVHHPHPHRPLQQHDLQTSRRQNKAPTQAQQRHIQHQQATDPYMMNVPTNGNANVITNMEHLDMVIPQYRMSREVSTVPDLWEEWDSGLNGGPIVRELEEKYGTRWRQNSAERKFFCLRKVIIDYVMRICNREGIPIEESVNRVEEIRKANQFTSLQRLAEHLKKIRKMA